MTCQLPPSLSHPGLYSVQYTGITSVQKTWHQSTCHWPLLSPCEQNQSEHSNLFWLRSRVTDLEVPILIPDASCSAANHLRACWRLLPDEGLSRIVVQQRHHIHCPLGVQVWSVCLQSYACKVYAVKSICRSLLLVLLLVS